MYYILGYIIGLGLIKWLKVILKYHMNVFITIQEGPFL